MNEDWTLWDCDQLRFYADRLRRVYHDEGYLPYPGGAKVREAHAFLSAIVEGMDKKQKELAA